VTSLSQGGGTARSEITLANFFRIFLAAGVTLPPEAGSGTHCFEIGLDAGGDAVVLREVPNPQPEGPTVPSLIGGRSPAPFSSLPSTSTRSEILVLTLALAVVSFAGAALAVWRLMLRHT
jgi:hypothetical protein